MNTYRRLSFLLAALLLLPLSCKKDDSTETLPSLDGSLSFSVEGYARSRKTLTVTPYGVTHPEGKEVCYYIKGSAGVLIQKPDSVWLTPGITTPGRVKFSFSLPDSIATYTITCTAIDRENAYYSTSTAVSVRLVRPGIGGSLTGTGIEPGDDNELDTRTPGAENERRYYFTSVAGLDWFRNNLAYTGSGVAYQNCEVLSYPLGRYYTYDEAMTACPDGWRLPSDAEWDALVAATGCPTEEGRSPGAGSFLMVDAFFNGQKMWEYWPDVPLLNALDLAVIPAGYANRDGIHSAYVGIEDYAAFWTSTLTEDGTQARFRYLNVNSPDLYTGVADRHSFAASVRCVR